MNASSRKNVCTNSTTEPPEQTVKVANTVNFIRTFIRTYQSFTALLRSFFWNFEHVFYWAIV